MEQCPHQAAAATEGREDEVPRGDGGGGGCPFGHGSATSTASGADLYYNRYLCIDKLLSCQNPESAKAGNEAHEEMLFIITHQTYELWFKQILHEVDSIIALLNRDYVEESCLSVINSRLRRVVEIEKVLVDQIRILETMSPQEFLDFRTYLTPASGFQSVQFRLLETRLGLDNRNRVQYQMMEYLSYFEDGDAKLLSDANSQPSLLSALNRWLERTPFVEFDEFNFWDSYKKAVEDMLEEDRMRTMENPMLTEEARKNQLAQIKKSEDSFATLFDEAAYNKLVESGQRRLSYRALQAALLISLYREQPMFALPFQLLTLLTDIDEFLTTWRYRHTIMVQRMIGMKLGSGGSAGYYYLRSTVSDRYKVFIDIFALSTYLIPRSKLPELPVEVGKQMGFHYSRHASGASSGFHSAAPSGSAE